MTAESQAPKPETLNLIFDWVKDAPARQKLAGDALDAKIIQILAVGSFILGLATAMRGTADNATAFLLLAVVAYAVGTVFALGGLFIRNYSVTEYADRLWSIYKDTDAEELKSSLVESIEKAYPCNERIIRQKAIAVRGVVILLGFEAVFLALDVADFSLL